MKLILDFQATWGRSRISKMWDITVTKRTSHTVYTKVLHTGSAEHAKEVANDHLLDFISDLPQRNRMAYSAETGTGCAYGYTLYANGGEWYADLELRTYKDVRYLRHSYATHAEALRCTRRMAVDLCY